MSVEQKSRHDFYDNYGVYDDAVVGESFSRRPGTNHRSKKMVKTPDLGKSLF